MRKNAQGFYGVRIFFAVFAKVNLALIILLALALA